MRGLACIIMDGIDVDLIRAFDLDLIHDVYMDNGNVLTCSTFPHTQASNIMIWSGEHRNWFWIRNNTHRWVDPAQEMDRDNEFEGGFKENKDIKIITEEDIKNDGIGFIWEKDNINARAVQLPITLPPISHNAPEKTEAWFPYWEEGIEQNRIDKHRITMNSLGDIADGELDFYCTSFCSPDKALHAPAEGHASKEFCEKEIRKLDDVAKDIHEFSEENEIGYVIFGDHGGPRQLQGPQFGSFEDQKIKVVRHSKHSVIFGNIEPLPNYTHEMYGWMREKLEV